MDFAVRYGEMAEDQGTWVLGVDPVGERLLVSDAEGNMHWHALADCKLFKAATPDNPRHGPAATAAVAGARYRGSGGV